MRTEAERISDDTGLPLVDVLDMSWDYPGSESDDLEEVPDADDFSGLSEYVTVEAPEWTHDEILNDCDPGTQWVQGFEGRFDPQDV